MKLKRGTKREDGLIFHSYQTTHKNGEYWISEEKYLQWKEKNKTLDKAKRERYKMQASYKSKNAKAAKKWRAKNPKLCREYDKRTKSKYKDDPIYKLKNNYRCRLVGIMKTKSLTKKEKTQKVLGCMWEDFKSHLEAQFTEGMTWENYGLYGWHVDHITPLAAATTEEELIILMHYTNTQPLWAKDNLKKGASLPL